MKKIMAIVLSMILLLGCAAAVAENAENAEKTELGSVNVNGAYRIQGTIPEGYRLSILEQSSTAIVCMLVSEDQAKPTVTVSVAVRKTGRTRKS